MKLSGFAGIISSMFTDTMTINRYVPQDNEDSTTDLILPDTPIYEDVPCRISFISDESPKDKEVDNNPIKLSPKIFCGVSVDLKAGDKVTIIRKNDKNEIIATYSGKVGLPSTFITHKEALFYIEESA